MHPIHVCVPIKHKTAIQSQQNPWRESSWSLLPGYSPCEQQMASLLPFLCPVQLLHSSCSHPARTNPAFSHLSTGEKMHRVFGAAHHCGECPKMHRDFGAAHHCGELPEKLSLPSESAPGWEMEIFTLFPSVMPVTA